MSNVIIKVRIVYTLCAGQLLNELHILIDVHVANVCTNVKFKISFQG